MIPPDPGALRDRDTLDVSQARKALGGFFVAGVLFAFPGAILPAWGYHLTSDFVTVGNYFLAMNLGTLAAIWTASRLLPRKGVPLVLTLACGLACAALLYLAVLPPEYSPWWRMLGVLGAGFGVGLLHPAVFHVLSPAYLHNRAATVNLAGIFLGLGCLVAALLVAGTYYVYTVPSILVFLALIPGFFSAAYARWSQPLKPTPPQPSLRETFREFRSPGAVLFSLLLFFQMGNEFCVAGWLALFLTQRLGVSPESSLWMLSLYWLALLVGRVAFQAVLPFVRHGRLLVGSVLATLFGCIILFSTAGLFGAGAGILLLGTGFTAIYPLVAEKIGFRFPYYHPGFYNGIFAFGLTGGMLAPWTMGIYAHFWGIRVVVLLPALGTCMVFVLLLLLWLETKLTGEGTATSAGV